MTMNRDDFWISLSVNECESARVLGFDSAQINRLLVRVSEFFLAKGHRLVFGHDWREDGVMRAIGDLAETLPAFQFESRDASFPRILNVVPNSPGEALSRVGIIAEKQSAGLIEVRRLQDLYPNPPNARQNLHTWEHLIPDEHAWQRTKLPKYGDVLSEKYSRFWILRKLLTDIIGSGARICLGGKTHGYTGYFAGIAEEAYFCIRANRPLYLIGGYGGTTAEVAVALLGEGSKFPAAMYREDLSSEEKHPLIAPPRKDLKNAGVVQAAKLFGMPPDGNLKTAFANYGIESLCRCNGLSQDENEQLFGCNDIEEALGIIHRGIEELLNRKAPSEGTAR